MALTTVSYDDDEPMPFPAFLARRTSPAIEETSRPPSWRNPIRRLIAAMKSPAEHKMRNGTDMQEIPTIGRTGTQARVSQPIGADEDRRLIDAVMRPLESIRAVLGERAVNSVLHGLLRQSNANLEAHGARQPDHETAELESLRDQLRQAQQINSNGHAAYRKLAAELAELRDAVSPDDAG